VLDKVVLLNFVNLNVKENEMVRLWRNHSRIRRWMYSSHIISSKEHTDFINNLKDDKKNFFWIVRYKEGKYLGVVYLNRLDLTNKNAYLGIYANPNLKGVGNILIGCLKELSFNIINLHSLKLEVIESNKRAVQFYKKIGFKDEGCLKEYVFKNGKWVNVIIMGLIRRHDKFSKK
jgi:UDP-4-amino-4,6-dideoxy-N-acetyl-beta-L-altrosamine N-acetyltransferase